MTKMIWIASAALFSLSACSDEPKSSTTTRLDAVEVQSGSISDAMISLDQVASDGTAIDNSVPVDPSKKAAPKVDVAEDAADVAAPLAASSAGDVVVTPNGPAPTPTPKS